jgi:hypothetical protein
VLACAGCNGVRFLQQLTRLGDEFCHFEGLHEVGDVVLLQEGALVAGAVGEGKQDVAFHGRAIFFEPLVRLLGVPLAGELAVHDEGVKLF